MPLTVLVAARNEELNIARCLRALGPAERVVVVDSDSADATASIASKLGAEVVQFDYRGGYPRKRQWALENLDIQTPWVMLVDADEVVPPTLWHEISEAIARGKHDAFLVTKGFHFMGRRFRFGGFSHAAVVLFRTGRARFERVALDPADEHDMEVHERVIVEGSVGRLSTPLVHEDFKGLAAYRERHRRYAVWEANARRQFLHTGRWGDDTVAPRLFGNSQERRRFLKSIAVRMPMEPLLWFVYHYLLKLGFIEGIPGLIASLVRAKYIADVRKRVRLLRRDKSRSDDIGDGSGAA